MYTTSYIPPTPDASQDISAASLKRENGVNVLKFKKKINSGDDKVRMHVQCIMDILTIRYTKSEDESKAESESKA